jgi:hypothetical protein
MLSAREPGRVDFGRVDKIAARFDIPIQDLRGQFAVDGASEIVGA